jgi:hypothetical protein
MPPAVSDRYHLEMRIGRDGDIEEWLATDTSLERPVLIRSLGPESSPRRRGEFVAGVSGAARVAHPHLIRVFAVEEVEGGAYAVCEWNGGATLADRVAASQTMDLEEFLPNAAGLAGGLAALHAAGGAHGSIDLSALSYSVAHPAKLGAWGRQPSADATGDVMALASALETALTGSPPGGPPPSESIDGVPRAVDHMLRSAQSGRLDAEELEKAVLATPTLRPSRPESPTMSRRLLVAAIVLVLLAVGLVALGLVLTGGGPIIPVSPITTIDSGSSTTTVPPATTIPVGGTVTVLGAESFDPFGEGGENDQEVANLLDGDPTTRWRSERYLDPLSLQKPGVGLRFEVEGTPASLDLIEVSPGTVLELRWSPEVAETVDDWERVVGVSSQPESVSFPLPPREGGHWLVWMTDLPLQPDGTYYVEISEVRFVP